MKRFTPLIILFIGILIVLFIVGHTAEDVSALPEYSAQVGEPCSSCHISPSGGGPRGPRGQAWVGSGKPGIVPDLIEALELLGVHLEVDLEDYTIVPETIPPPQPLQIQPGEAGKIHEWLKDHDGN